jgi:hypothetical protein
VTTITEKKRSAGAIFGFLFVVFALAAWRGMDGAPVLAAACGVAALACAAYLVWFYVTPASVLSIAPTEIRYGRPGKPGTAIPRSASGHLAFHQGFRRSGWFLVSVDAPDGPPILMTGFDMNEVAAACIAQGWTFAEGEAATAS